MYTKPRLGLIIVVALATLGVVLLETMRYPDIPIARSSTALAWFAVFTFVVLAPGRGISWAITAALCFFLALWRPRAPTPMPAEQVLGPTLLDPVFATLATLLVIETFLLLRARRKLAGAGAEGFREPYPGSHPHEPWPGNNPWEPASTNEDWEPRPHTPMAIASSVMAMLFEDRSPRRPRTDMVRLAFLLALATASSRPGWQESGDAVVLLCWTATAAVWVGVVIITSRWLVRRSPTEGS